jgi:hypothetical protein
VASESAAPAKPGPLGFCSRTAAASMGVAGGRRGAELHVDLPMSSMLRLRRGDEGRPTEQRATDGTREVRRAELREPPKWRVPRTSFEPLEAPRCSGQCLPVSCESSSPQEPGNYFVRETWEGTNLLLTNFQSYHLKIVKSSSLESRR